MPETTRPGAKGGEALQTQSHGTGRARGRWGSSPTRRVTFVAFHSCGHAQTGARVAEGEVQ